MAPFITQFISRFAVACKPGAGGNFLGLPTWYKYLDGQNLGGKCTVQIDLTNHPGQVSLILLALVEILLRVAGLVAVGFVIYGGFRYITSQGEPENTKAALHTIINALIGVGIAVIASVVVSFIARSLT